MDQAKIREHATWLINGLIHGESYEVLLDRLEDQNPDITEEDVDAITYAVVMAEIKVGWSD